LLTTEPKSSAGCQTGSIMRRHSACEVLAFAAPDRSDRSGVSATPIVIERPDVRADGVVRRVELSPGEVTIERLIAGVRMRLVLASTLYEGVALDVCGTTKGAVLRVRLAHDDRDLDVVLYEATDDRDVTAEWQYWANFFGLPLLIAEHDGRLSQPFPRLGTLDVGAPRARRVPSDFAKRRPRFLTRRRVGRSMERPVVHAGREIIARD
jgi:hypothetical protein